MDLRDTMVPLREGEFYIFCTSPRLWGNSSIIFQHLKPSPNADSGLRSRSSVKQLPWVSSNPFSFFSFKFQWISFPWNVAHHKHLHCVDPPHAARGLWTGVLGGTVVLFEGIPRDTTTKRGRDEPDIRVSQTAVPLKLLITIHLHIAPNRGTPGSLCTPAVSPPLPAHPKHEHPPGRDIFGDVRSL